jgi:hypothetical protein
MSTTACQLGVQVEAPFRLARLVTRAPHPALEPHTAALERLSTGLAAKLYADNIAVNALSPSKVVLTPGTIFHHLTTNDDPDAEPPALTGETSPPLFGADPRTLIGRIAYSRELLIRQPSNC